jgi:uncharacterized membrane protein
VNGQGSSARRGTAAAPAPAEREADGPAGRFLAGVRAALADLPAGEVREILDDVRSHLSDLAAELGDALDDRAVAARLGTPAGYAAELRAAAGYPPPVAAPEAGPARGTARLAVVALVASTLLIPAGLVARSAFTLLLGVAAVLLALPALTREGPRMTAVAELPEVRRLGALRPRADGPGGRVLADLQSAWWVGRALAAAWAVAIVLGDGGPAVVLVLVAVAVPVSMRLGRLARRDRRLLWVVVPLNALAVGLALFLLAWAQPRPAAESSGSPVPNPPGLRQDGEEVRDIRPVDASGVPLSGVYLFDQDGRPIDTRANTCQEYESGGAYDAGGNPVSGPVQAYPRGTPETDPATGRCVVVPPGPLMVAVPPPAAAVPPTAAPTPAAPTPAAPTPTASPAAPRPGAPSGQLTPPPVPAFPTR